MSTETSTIQEPAPFTPPQWLNARDGERIAYRRVPGRGPTLLWLGGFLSDMTGSKVAKLRAVSAQNGWDCLCFDYFAHGETGGAFSDARVGRWFANVLAVVDELTQGPLVAVGSSMGGHLLSLLLKARPERVAAAGFVAPAADFVTDLMLPALTPEERRELEVSGIYMMPGYDRPVPVSQAFFDEAANWRVLDAPIAFHGPVRILHGMRDDVVPWQQGLKLLEGIMSSNARIELIKDGDHRLSRPQDLDRLIRMVEDLYAEADLSAAGR